METQEAKAARFLAAHRNRTPLLLPNPWDQGAARLFAWLGFEAVATTSSGFAATRGRLDGSMSRDEVLAHSGSIVEAATLPVSADLEHGFGDDPADVAETVELALERGVAGCSIEDSTGRADAPLYEVDLADTIARLQAYQEAGADVVYAPGLVDIGDIRRLVAAVDRPVNVLARPGGPSVGELAQAGVARVSVGGSSASPGSVR